MAESEAMNFEKAAEYRDRLRAVEAISENRRLC